MLKRKFKLSRHPEFGTMGLAPTWMSADQSDPLTGMGVAHDILEHGPHDCVEWQGLGGSVLVRGQGGYYRNAGPAENIASDFTELYHLWEGKDIPACSTRPLTNNDAWAEDIIQDAVEAGCKLLKEELSDDEDKEAVTNWTRPEQQRRMVGWMRKGFRACQKRWIGNIGTILDTFKAIEAAVDDFLKHNGEEYEGAEVIIQFDPTTAKVDVSLVEEEDY